MKCLRCGTTIPSGEFLCAGCLARASDELSKRLVFPQGTLEIPMTPSVRAVAASEVSGVRWVLLAFLIVSVAMMVGATVFRPDLTRVLGLVLVAFWPFGLWFLGKDLVSYRADLLRSRYYRTTGRARFETKIDTEAGDSYFVHVFGIRFQLWMHAEEFESLRSAAEGKTATVDWLGPKHILEMRDAQGRVLYRDGSYIPWA